MTTAVDDPGPAARIREPGPAGEFDLSECVAQDLRAHPGWRIQSLVGMGAGSAVISIGAYTGFVQEDISGVEGYVVHLVIILLGTLMVVQGAWAYRGLVDRPTRLSVSSRGLFLRGDVLRTQFDLRWDRPHSRLILQELTASPGVREKSGIARYRLLYQLGSWAPRWVPLTEPAFRAILDEASHQDLTPIPRTLVGATEYTIVT